MQNLYQQLQRQQNTQGLPSIVDKVVNSSLFPTIKNKLISEGYNISKLNNKGVAILFCALVDILYIVKDGSFYIATMSQEKVNELLNLKRIVNRDDETNYQKTSQVVYGNTKEVINQYLEQGKFHFMKLNQLENIKYKYFMITISGMNPYPSLEYEDVYTLSDLTSWHNELYNQLMLGCLQLNINGEKVVCTSYNSKDKSLCTSGELLTRDIDSEPIRYKLWEIKGYEKYSRNDFVMRLLNGVVKYDNKYVTLNRNILEKYYGAKLYTSLESIGVRQRYCLEELTSVNPSYNVAYYVNKYNLNIFDCESIYDLEQKLKSIVEVKHSDPKYVSARVLISYKQIESGHKSFYQRIDLTTLNLHDVTMVDDISSVLPRFYKYYAISKSIGYSFVEVTATSDDLALKYGKTEFERQFGKETEFCSLACNDVIVKGKPLFSLGVEIQRELCQQLMYGYVQNFKGYSEVLYKILDTNQITRVSDDCIKYLYVNKVALKYNKGQNPKLEGIISILLDFLILCKDTDKLKASLTEEYIKISLKQCSKEYANIVKAYPDYDNYAIKDTADGRFIITNFGRYKIKADNTISQLVEIFHNGEYLGVRRVKI